MKREDETRKGKYEWEMEYSTNEKPLSKTDRALKLLFGLVSLAATLAFFPRLVGATYTEMYGKLLKILTGQ